MLTSVSGQQESPFRLGIAENYIPGEGSPIRNCDALLPARIVPFVVIRIGAGTDWSFGRTASLSSPIVQTQPSSSDVGCSRSCFGERTTGRHSNRLIAVGSKDCGGLRRQPPRYSNRDGRGNRPIDQPYIDPVRRVRPQHSPQHKHVTSSLYGAHPCAASSAKLLICGENYTLSRR
jgi:hypothetical protein